MHILVYITPRGVNHSTVHCLVGEEEKTGQFYQRVKPLLNTLNEEIRALQLESLGGSRNLENMK